MHYLTEEKLQQLKQEHEKLKEGRREIASRLEEAKSLGDLSENIEYSEACDARSFNEGKIIEIEKILKDAVIIDRPKSKRDIIQLGSRVQVETNKKIRDFILVGSEEADPASGKISNESPLGRAFLGHKVDDVVEVQAPIGKVKYKIVSVS